MTLPSSSPPFFTSSVPHFLLLLCFFFLLLFSQLSHTEKNTSVFASINSSLLFFYTPFKRANTSLIFPLNTLHSFCLYPPLLSLSLFPGVTSACSVIWWAKQCLRHYWHVHYPGYLISWHWCSLTFQPVSSDLWHAHTSGDRWSIKLQNMHLHGD